MKISIYIIFLDFFLIVFILGIMFNSLAVLKNDCKMPVLSSTNFETMKHKSFQDKEEVNYFYLTDIIRLKNYTYSIGDFLLYFGGGGLALILIMQIGQIKKLKRLEELEEWIKKDG